MKLLPLLLCLTLVAGGAARADAPARPDPSQLAAPGSKIELPGLTIHGGPQKLIALDAAVALTQGILEFLIVETGGRDYESLFTTDCKPSALQFALLLIGCEPGALPRLAKDGERTGTQLTIEAQWESDGATKREPINRLLVERKTGQPPATMTWFFTGSYFGKSVLGDGEVFMADVEQAHSALWWTRAVLINLGGDFGNPYQEDDQGFDVNTKLLPPVKTPVKLLIRRHE